MIILVRITLIMYSVVDIAKLLVHIVAGKEHKLPTLIVIVVCNSPNADSISLIIVPIKAVQVLVAQARTVSSVFFERENRLLGGRAKCVKLLSRADMIV